MNIIKADMRMTMNREIELLLTVQADPTVAEKLIHKVNEKPHTVKLEPLKRKR